jgi:hypothetical protein
MLKSLTSNYSRAYKHLKITDFGNITLCSLVEACWHFVEAYCRHLQGCPAETDYSLVRHNAMLFLKQVSNYTASHSGRLILKITAIITYDLTNIFWMTYDVNPIIRSQQRTPWNRRVRISTQQAYDRNNSENSNFLAVVNGLESLNSFSDALSQSWAGTKANSKNSRTRLQT